MDSTVTTSVGQNSWQVVPAHPVVAVVFGLLLLYWFFRHFLLVMMIFDLMIGWLRQFSWFPTEGKRLKAILHWLVALGLFLGFQAIAAAAGWLSFIPQ